MPIELLTLLKFALLALLYLFVGRTVKTVATEVTGGRRRKNAPTPRPAVASPSEQSRRSRRIPKELVIHVGSGSPKVVPLSGHGVVLGRRNVDVLLDDVYVSDEHAQVMPDDGSWSVRDLGSTNGTFLNGAKVTRPTPLAVGDQIRVGKTHIEVRR